MVNAEFVESILKIFAVRAAAELERQRAEETLRRSEASYRAIFEASEDAVFIHDWDTGAIIDVNRRACEIYGYSYEEMKRINIAELSSGEYPYTGEEAMRKLAGSEGRQAGAHRVAPPQQGRRLHWDEVVLRPAVIAGERRVLAFTREITERKQAEQALRQAQKMEALGHLTGGIAHDFNNLLTSIMGYVVLAAEQPAAQRTAPGEVSRAGAALVRARARSHPADAHVQPRPARAAAAGGARASRAQSVKLFGSSLPSTLEIETTLDDEVPAVMLDPVHLDQILLNLCLNARDAMSGVGTIRVSVAAHTAANRVHGVPADRRRRVRRALRRGRRPRHPAGDRRPHLRAVLHHEGRRQRQRHGARERARHRARARRPHRRGYRARTRHALPRALPLLTAAQEGELADAERARAGARLHGHVLVVDDEQAVGAFMRDLLESWGLAVTVAASADERCPGSQDAQRFDLVITDHMMPRMTGTSSRASFRGAGPICRSFSTPASTKASRQRRSNAGLRAVITKPIDPHALFGLLQTHLPSPPGSTRRS